MGLGITLFVRVLLFHVCRQIDASMALPAERSLQRAAAILEDARLLSERSKVCLLQHGSGLAVSMRSAIPTTSRSNETDLLQRPAMFFPRSTRRALVAEGGPSNVKGLDERVGVGSASSRDTSIAALSRRYPPINSSAYFLDAEKSLTASFDALQDSIKTPSRMFHSEHAPVHIVDAEDALTASFSALQDSIKTQTLSAANKDDHTKTAKAWNSGADALQRPSRKLLSMNGLVRSPGAKEAIDINSSARYEGMQKHHSLRTLSALQRYRNNFGRLSQIPSLRNRSMYPISVEQALTPNFNVPADNETMHRASRRTTSRGDGALVSRETNGMTHERASVSGSIPSKDAENALKPSFVALQNSMKMQQSLKREHFDLQRKARAAEWEAAQTKAADERLLQQDVLIRQEDMRLRGQDEELRTENKRLQQLVSQLTKADAEGRHVHQSSLLSAWEDGAPETSLLLSALLESRAEPAELAENSSDSTISNKSRTAASGFFGSSKTGDRTVQTEKTVVLCAGALGLFFAWVIFHAISFFVFNAKDETGDGGIDFADFEEHMAGRVCCGLGASAARGILGVLIIAAAGFAFLWSQNIIQPFLKEFACYVYLGGVVFLLVGVLLAELWASFQDVFLTQIQALGRLMSFFKIDTGDINMEKFNIFANADSDRPRSQLACC